MTVLGRERWLGCGRGHFWVSWAGIGQDGRSEVFGLKEEATGPVWGGDGREEECVLAMLNFRCPLHLSRDVSQ